MDGKPKNKLNMIRKEMERDNKEVAQDGVESAASPLRVKNQVGKLSGSAGYWARTWYKRVKGWTYSAPIGMKSAVPNSLNKNLHEQIDANKSNKFGSSGRNKSEKEKASKGQEGREINQKSWICNDKIKSGEYVLNWPPKKPGGKEAMTCESASIS